MAHLTTVTLNVMIQLFKLRRSPVLVEHVWKRPWLSNWAKWNHRLHKHGQGRSGMVRALSCKNFGGTCDHDRWQTMTSDAKSSNLQTNSRLTDVTICCELSPHVQYSWPLPKLDDNYLVHPLDSTDCTTTPGL